MSARSTPGAARRGFGDHIILVAVLALSIAMIAPALWVIGLSLKDNHEVMANPNSVFHPPYIIDNYVNILYGGGVLRWILNSLIVSVGLTFGTLLL